MAETPTSRTKSYYRSLGYEIGVVEKWVIMPKFPGGGKRFDLFGIIDLIAINGKETLGIQATSTSNLGARKTKALDEEHRRVLSLWLESGNRFILIGWAKRGKVGKRKLWTPAIKELILSDTRENKARI